MEGKEREGPRMLEEGTKDEKMTHEEARILERLIAEDNVEELSKILNSKNSFRNNFNSFLSSSNIKFSQMPLLHFAVQENCQKVVEYLLSQDFVDKSVCNLNGENIYHVICRIRGAEELFSIIERKVPHHLLFYPSQYGINTFHIACELNNIFIVKRVHEILKSLKVDLTSIKRNALECALENDDIEVVKYVISIDGIQLNDDILKRAMGYTKFDIVVHLLNVYLCQSIPSHLHNQFHIFQFSNLHYQNNGILQYNNHNNNHNNHNNNNNDYYLKIVEENYQKIIDKLENNRIWREVCENEDFGVVQLIFSLKGIFPEILNIQVEGENPFLLSCKLSSNIKVIKNFHKLFPSFINSKLFYSNGKVQNGAHLLVDNYNMKILFRTDKLKILHYLYLNGIDIHFISKFEFENRIIYHSLYTKIIVNNLIYDIYDENIVQYLQVISQDFDYLHNEHDREAYRKPSFWKEIDDRNNIDEQSMGINEWKNRFDEHVLHHLSKMIQQQL